MEICIRANTGNEVNVAADKVLCGYSHYRHEPACDLWLNPCVFDLGVLHAAGVRYCQGGEAFVTTLSLWPAGSATHIAIDNGGPTAWPHALGLAIVPCGPSIGCCDTPGRLRLVRTLLTVCRRTMTVGRLLFHSFVCDFHTTFCPALLVRCNFSAFSHRALMYNGLNLFPRTPLPVLGTVLLFLSSSTASTIYL